MLSRSASSASSDSVSEPYLRLLFILFIFTLRTMLPSARDGCRAAQLGPRVLARRAMARLAMSLRI